MKIPVANLRPALEAARADCRACLDQMFERSQFILGEQVAAFEREFAAHLGARYAVGVGTGTAAIELSLRDAGVNSRGQEVITSALTAPFTGVAIVAAGAGLRLADVDPETLLLDPGDVENRLSRRTAAIVPVHLYGAVCPMDRFAAHARLRRLVLVQDACQAHGARYRGRPLTAYSPYVAYSFYPTKNLGCLGDGGAVVTNRAAIHRRLRGFRDGGRRGGQVAFTAGVNSRLDEMQACYLRAFLPRLAQWNARRSALAALYDEALRDSPGLRLVRRTEESVCHLYVIRARRRDRLRDYLARHGIGTGVHYPVPLHLMPAFRDRGLRRGDLPHAERACREVVSLPLWPDMTEAEAYEVAGRVRRFYR